MKLFVAGGTGVLGSRVVPLLVERGHEVSVIARSDAKADDVRAVGATPVRVSLFDADALATAVVGHEVVINVATHIPSIARSGHAKAWQENDRIRTEGVHNLVEAAAAAGAARVVQESLAFVYADHGDEWILEGEPPIASADVLSVLRAEAEVARFTAAGGVGVALRFGQFYAPGSSHTESLLKGARRGWLLLPGPPDAYAVSVAADDAATAVVAALEAPAGVYHVVDDEPLTRREWSRVLAEAVGRKRDLRLLPGAVTKSLAGGVPDMANSQRVSNAAFKQATGWAPQQRSFRDGVRLLVEPSGSDHVRSDGTR